MLLGTVNVAVSHKTKSEIEPWRQHVAAAGLAKCIADGGHKTR